MRQKELFPLKKYGLPELITVVLKHAVDILQGNIESGSNVPSMMVKNYLKRHEFKFLGAGIARMCFMHNPSGKVFKLAESYYDCSGIKREFDDYWKHIAPKDHRYFATPKGHFFDYALGEYAMAKGKRASDSEFYDCFDRSILDAICSRYGIGDMHDHNYFIYGADAHEFQIVDFNLSW